MEPETPVPLDKIETEIEASPGHPKEASGGGGGVAPPTLAGSPPPPPSDPLTTLLALTLAEAQARKSTSNGSSSTGKAAAVTGMVAALATLLGAFTAAYTAVKALNTANEAAAIQRRLEINDVRLQENGRILNLGYQVEDSCGGIPLDELTKWREYCECILPRQNGCEDQSALRSVQYSLRHTCAVRAGVCRSSFSDAGVPSTNR